MNVSRETFTQALAGAGFTPEECDQAGAALVAAQEDVQALVHPVGQASALKQEHCRSCRAAIIWLKHATSGKAAPIDAAPAPGGNILINAPAGTYRIIGAKDRATFAGQLHLNHFSTCPDAKRWGTKAR